MLLLDPQTEETARAKIVADAVDAINAQGELVRQDDWGERALAYPIDRKPNADYHLLQFHVGQVGLLDSLDRTLRITDGVIRHRIIKLAPGTPNPPEMTAQRRAETPEGEASAPAPAAEAPAPAPAESAPAEAAAPEAAPEAAAPEAPPAEAPSAEAAAASEAAESA
jgi:small subunit ribosomal protein S6